MCAPRLGQEHRADLLRQGVRLRKGASAGFDHQRDSLAAADAHGAQAVATLFRLRSSQAPSGELRAAA